MDADERTFAKLTLCYDIQDYGRIMLYRQCPKCNRFLSFKHLEIFERGLGDVWEFRNVICKSCGIVTPNGEWV